MSDVDSQIDVFNHFGLAALAAAYLELGETVERHFEDDPECEPTGLIAAHLAIGACIAKRLSNAWIGGQCPRCDGVAVMHPAPDPEAK